MRHFTGLLPLLLAAAMPHAAWGQTAPNRDDAVQAEITELRRRLAALEATVAQDTARATPAAAQPITPIATAPAALRRPELNRLADQHVLAAPLDQAVQDPNISAAFQLTGGTEGKRAEMLLSRTISRTRFGGGARGPGLFETFALSASAPLGEDGPTNIGTLASVDDGFALKLRYTSFQAELVKPSAAEVFAAHDRARANCRERRRGAPDVKALCNEAEPTSAFLIEYLGNDGFDALNQGFFGKAAFAWGLEATVGYQAFKFLNPATAAAADTSRWPVGAKVFASVFPGSGRTALLGSFAYERSFKAAKPGTLCPASTDPVVTCATGPLGGPSRENRYILSLGERSAVELGRNALIPRFAIAPTVNYEIESDTFGFDLPIYLVPDGDGNLIGGLRLGYTSEGDDISFGVFVGSTFSLFQ